LTLTTSTAFDGPVYSLYAGYDHESAVGQPMTMLSRSERVLPVMHVSHDGQHADWGGGRFLRLNGKVIMVPACILNPVSFLPASMPILVR